MKALVNQLSTFNKNFKSNTDSINTTLNTAKEVYKSQANVIEEYKAIDLEGIANGVSSIMRRLRSSTESLDNFTQYLNIVHDYYEDMQVFVEKLDKETERIGILEDIQRFFQSHKAVIAEETADAHKNLKDSIKALQDSTEQQVNETYTALTEQSKKLKDAVDENNVQFRNLCQDMRDKFKEQMDEMPTIAQGLKQLESIPNMLDNAVDKIIESQERLSSNFLTASQNIVNNVGKRPAKLMAEDNYNGNVQTNDNNPSQIVILTSIKWTLIIGITLITLASIGNTAYNIWKGETDSASKVETVENEDGKSMSIPTFETDSANIPN